VCAGTEAPAEAREQRKGEPPILSSPRMARDAAEGRNLRRVQAEEPPTKKRRRICSWAKDPSLRLAEALDGGHMQGS
jgi:hypothetical protein